MFSLNATRKTALTAACLMAACTLFSVAIADVNVGYSASAGFFTTPDGQTPLFNSPGSVLVQLIFSTNGVIGAATDDPSNQYLDTTSGNRLLHSFTLSWNGSSGTAASWWGDFSQSVELYTGYGTGTVFVRVFQLATPTAGSWYYNSAKTSVPLYNPDFPSFTTAPGNRDNMAGDGLYPGAPNNFQVQAGTSPPPYVITYLANGNGSILGANPQAVIHGASGSTVTARPSLGWYFADWNDGNTNATRRETDVTSSLTFTARFERIIYTLAYLTNGSGTVAGANPQTVFYGDQGTTVTAQPSVGWYFADWSDGRTNVARQETNVTSHLAITARFERITYTLAYLTNGSGTVAGANPQTVFYGDHGTSVTAQPSVGWYFADWNDGNTNATRRETNVASSLTFTARFERLSYTLTYRTNGNGTVDGPNPQTVLYGDHGASVTARPAMGWSFVSWSDGKTNATRRETNVASHLTLTASFVTNGGGGTADLVLSSIVVSPVAGEDRAPNYLDIVVQVSNAGTTPVQGGLLNVWGNMPWTAESGLKGDLSAQLNDLIQPGQSVSVTFRGSFPFLHTQPGTNYIRAFVDAQNGIIEKEEYNNQAYVLYAIPAWPTNTHPYASISHPFSALMTYYSALEGNPDQDQKVQVKCDQYKQQGLLADCPDYEAALLSDLSITTTSLAYTNTANGWRIIPCIRVKNDGARSLNRVLLYAWADKAEPAQPEDLPDVTVSIPVLPAFSSTDVYMPMMAPPTNRGWADFRAFVDPANAVAETGESNNQWSARYQTQGGGTSFKLKATALQNSVVVRWPDPAECGMQSSTVLLRVATNNYPSTTLDGTLLPPTNGTVYTHSSLQAGVSYYYTIWVSDNGVDFFEPPEIP